MRREFYDLFWGVIAELFFACAFDDGDVVAA